MRVTLVQATNLPRMDLISGCDPYCVLFVNACSGLSTFASEVKNKNVNPVWDQKFEWKMTRQTKVLSVTLWDKD
uniref:C2 domain-containing protein n=1 Tax=Guillardia theta (strain CCMP2712) TaxID=905079 RepID=A0A0C3SQF4_GUITC